MNRETRNHIFWISLLWVVLSALGEWVVQIAIDNWPLIASREGEITGEAIFFLFRATVPVFILVVLIIAYSAIRFRVPQDDERPAEAQFASGPLFVTAWVGMSVIVNVIFVLYPGVYGLEALWSDAQAAAVENPLEIKVVGRQWEWEFHYDGQKIETINDLVVPVGRPIRFTFSTEDVMHSFWVPAWGMKKALMPGEERQMVITPTEEFDTRDDPTLRVQCAQICGAGHPLMRGGVRVVSAAAFDDWVKEQKIKGEKMHREMPGMDMSGGNMGGMNMNKGMNMGGDNKSGMGNMAMPGSKTMPMGTDSGTQMQNGNMGGMNMNSGGANGMNMGGDNKSGTSNMAMPGSKTMPMGTDGGTQMQNGNTGGMKMPESEMPMKPEQDSGQSGN